MTIKVKNLSNARDIISALAEENYVCEIRPDAVKKTYGGEEYEEVVGYFITVSPNNYNK